MNVMTRARVITFMEHVFRKVRKIMFQKFKITGEVVLEYFKYKKLNSKTFPTNCIFLLNQFHKIILSISRGIMKEQFHIQ